MLFEVHSWLGINRSIAMSACTHTHSHKAHVRARREVHEPLDFDKSPLIMLCSGFLCCVIVGVLFVLKVMKIDYNFTQTTTTTNDRTITSHPLAGMAMLPIHTCRNRIFVQCATKESIQYLGLVTKMVNLIPALIFDSRQFSMLQCAWSQLFWRFVCCDWTLASI